jgi:hypothetical protein
MKYIKKYKIFDSNSLPLDGKRVEWDGYNLGDRVEENAYLELNPLPESQVTPKDGIYELQNIPIDRTDIVIGGLDTRYSFKNDDYDGYQTKTLDTIKSIFDKLPPVIFEEKENGDYKHVDGHHRIIAAKELDRKYILAWVLTLDQSKISVVNKPIPKFKTIRKENSFLLKSYENRSDIIFLYKNRILSGFSEFFSIWHRLENKEDIKIMDKKFLPFLKIVEDVLILEEVTSDSVDNPNSKAAKMIKKKSDESGISQSILKKVYKRGRAAWNSGHRPGTPQEAWATGRVNSFITGKGGARKADSDLWKKAKDSK